MPEHSDNQPSGCIWHTSDASLSKTDLTRILTTLVGESSDAILLVDADDQLVFINDRFKELWQLRDEHLIPGNDDLRRDHIRNFANHPDSLQGLRARFSNEHGDHYAGEVTLQNGRLLTLSITRVNGGTEGFTGRLIVYRDQTPLRSVQQESNWFQMHDRTTGLLNRVAMFGALEHRVETPTPFALIVVDIDRFQRLNDEYGHRFGDDILKTVAETILTIVGTTRPLSRHGEDEFMLLVEGGNLASIEDLAQEIVDALTGELVVKDFPIVMSACAGVSTFPAVGTDANDLVSTALIALQHAKSLGSGRIHTYSSVLGRVVEERRKLEAQLAHAVDGSGLHLLYQPIYDLRTNEVSSCEVLLRWQSEELGSVPPSVFIPYAEESGLIIPIGEWVLRNACAQAAKWARAPHGAVPISVNVSAAQLSQPDFPATVERILRETGFSPFLLSLELTETVLVENLGPISQTIDRLRGMGIKMFIDDFGTGYSGFTYLKNFRVDTLKIDRSFVSGIGQTREDTALMQTAIGVAHSLGLIALAEGVETEEQLRFLAASDCDQVQGFLLNRPMNAAQIGDMLTAGDTHIGIRLDRRAPHSDD